MFEPDSPGMFSSYWELAGFAAKIILGSIFIIGIGVSLVRGLIFVLS